MTTLDDRLIRASREVRREIATIPLRPVAEVRRRRAGRRVLVGVGVAAVLAAMLAGTAEMARRSPAVGTPAGGSSPAGTVPGLPGADLPSTSAPGATPTDSTLPRLGLRSDAWAVLDAADSGSGTHLVYEGDPGMLGRRGLAAIEVWADLPDAAPGAAYAGALASLATTGNRLGDVEVLDATAAAFDYEDPNTGETGYAFVWPVSDLVTVQVIVYVDRFDQARAVVQSLEPLAEDEWTGILAAREPSTGTSLAPTTTLASTTTVTAPVGPGGSPIAPPAGG